MGPTRWVAQILLGLCVALGAGFAVSTFSEPVDAAVGDAVDILDPETVRSNGATLRWTRYTGPSGAPFDRYEIHRSKGGDFTPGASTLLTTIRHADVTSFEDTTAAPDATFTYKVVANTSPSSPVTVATPSTGTATKTLQPSPARGKASYLQKAISGTVSCTNHGTSSTLFLGGGAEVDRPVLQFDLHDIPAEAPILSATLSLYRQDSPAASTTIDVHRLRSAWEEGPQVSACSGGGTSWDEMESGVSWGAKGGDFASTPEASVARAAGAAAGWDTFDVKGVAQQWADGDAPNMGLIVKARDESSATAGTLHYVADDHGAAPAQRPKLVVSYQDGSQSKKPDVAFKALAAGDLLTGSAAEIEATAGDDRRVEKVDFLLDGGLIGTASSAPYRITWDSRAVSTADHTLTARATDDVGNVTAADVLVSVANTAEPATKVTQPSSAWLELALARGPIAFWRLGELTGSAAVDASGNNAHGTLTGSYLLGQTGLITGSTDKAVTFKNATTDGTLTAAVGAKAGAQVSAEAWINPVPVATAGQVNRIVSRGWGTSGANGGWLLDVRKEADGQQYAAFTVMLNGVNYTAKRVLPAGRAHIVGRYSGSELAIFVNGVYTLGGAPAGALNTTSSVVVGGSLVSDVLLDEVAIFDRMLSASDVGMRYDVGQGKPPSIKGDSNTALAAASDDRGVHKVEFYVDGEYAGYDSAVPFDNALKTKVRGEELWNGDHTIVSKAYDDEGQLKESTSQTVKVNNASAPIFAGTVTPATEMPTEVTYAPGAPTQDVSGFDVQVANTSTVAWPASDIVLKPRWIAPDGTTIAEQPEVALAADLPAGQAQSRTIKVTPPALPEGTTKAQYTLRVDPYQKSTGKFFAAEGNKPLDKPVNVKKAASDLGLEEWLQYDTEALGGGMTHLVNLASGNSLVRFSPLNSTGRGLSTQVDITYNGLEEKSESPLGNNWSIAISSLTRFGTPLDVHPNKADDIGGNPKRYIDLTDADGTVHRFTGKLVGGKVYWEEPAGVHLYLREFSSTDATRKWAITRPDRVTYFFDSDGFPTSVEDRHGNRLTYTLQATPPGEDPGGQKKRITAVTDASGRAYTVEYYGKNDAPKAKIRGRVRLITDHSGSRLSFRYFDDGNLKRIAQDAGVTAMGTPMDTRAWYFSYTTPNGDGPAEPDKAKRIDPDSTTKAQSSRLFSVRDARKHETTFAYMGSGAGQQRWKIKSRTNRTTETSTFAYDGVARTTTVSAPAGRTWKYAFDAGDQVTKITNPKSEDTSFTWTPERHMETVTTPTGRTSPTTATRRFTYNQNGLLTSATNEEGEKTQLGYEDFAVDANDVSAGWKIGRTVGHASILRSKTDPKGTATATPATDFQWTFDWDVARKNVVKVFDAEAGSAHATLMSPNPDGTVASISDANGNTTVYDTYDPSGQPTRITEPDNRIWRFGYDPDGYVRWVQDPLHSGDSGTDERSYKTFFDYDSWHRLGRQSTPKWTSGDRGNLVWSGVVLDKHDNVQTEHGPHYGRQWFDGGAITTATFDDMDRPLTEVGPHENETTTLSYDGAGRLEKLTDPRGNASTLAGDGVTTFGYDELDRVVRESRDEFENGALRNTLHTHYCFDMAGDLIAALPPAFNSATRDCNSAKATRFEYDLAHRQTKQQLPGKQPQLTGYDDNGNVETTTDEQGSQTKRFYDQRDLLTKVVEPFEGGTTPRNLTTRLQYDFGGRLVREVSPRAFDRLGDKADYPATDDYVTSYTYNGADELTAIRLPTGPGVPAPHHVLRRYDRNGNLASVSQPQESATAAADERRTDITSFDTGWVQAIDRPRRRKVTYDYTAEGWQQTMTPKLADGSDNVARQRIWSYFPDGMLADERTGEEHQLAFYRYDANNNLTLAHDEGSVVRDIQQKPIDVTIDYDSLDRPSKVRQSDAENGPTGVWTVTKYGYDLNSNVVERIENRREQPDGTQVDAGRRKTFTYDDADWLVDQRDFASPADATPERLIETTYKPTGWQSERRVKKNGVLKQLTDWDYNLNGLLKTMNTKAGDSLVVRESHQVSYYEGGDARFFSNGHRTRDVWRRDSPRTGVPCQAQTCTTSYTYDARDRLTKEVRSRGANTKTTDLVLDPSGNVSTETITGDGTQGVRFRSAYAGDQLDTRETLVPDGAGGWKTTEPSEFADAIDDDFKYFHDPVTGTLDCVTKLSGASRSLCNNAAGTTVPDGLVQDHSYDAEDKLLSSRGWNPFRNPGDQRPQDDAAYVYDALDRPVQQREHHLARGWTTARLTKFSYLGTSKQASEEQQYKIAALDTPADQGTLSSTKRYSYDPAGNRIGLTETTKVSGQPDRIRNYLYGYDAHGNAAQLLDEDAGSPRASYGFAYSGAADPTETAELKSDGVAGADPAQFTDDLESVNPYRYSGKRFDPGSRQLDMGARRYGPEVGRFIQEDSFDSALDDLGLSDDPLTNNRYALAGGNPVTFLEDDGHMPAYDSGTAARAATEARGEYLRGESSPGGYTGPVTDRSSSGGVTNTAAYDSVHGTVRTRQELSARTQVMITRRADPAAARATNKVVNALDAIQSGALRGSARQNAVDQKWAQYKRRGPGVSRKNRRTRRAAKVRLKRTPNTLLRVAKHPVARAGGKAFPAAGAFATLAVNEAEHPDDQKEALIRTGLSVGGSAAGAGAGGLACGTAAAATFGLGAATCPVLVGGGAVVGGALGDLSGDLADKLGIF
jgi:RHS repeat-associated protein